MQGAGLLRKCVCRLRCAASALCARSTPRSIAFESECALDECGHEHGEHAEPGRAAACPARDAGGEQPAEEQDPQEKESVAAGADVLHGMSNAGWIISLLLGRKSR